MKRGIAGRTVGPHPVGQVRRSSNLPMYRHLVIRARDGIDLDLALLTGWMGGANALLRTLADAIRKHMPATNL